MDYKVKIDEFEGPLDLLLHLIKEANIDIYDIKISEITAQYLQYITAMEELNLSVASEYLVMAAELIEIKSRMLLPLQSASDEDSFEEDPQVALIKRLVDYKNYKEITGTFKNLEESRQDIFTKLPSNIDEYKEDATPVEAHDVSLLLDAFAKFLERNESNKPLHTRVASKEISLSERVISIRNILRIKKDVTLAMLFERWTKDYIIVTFLAVLQMSKDQEIMLEQQSAFDDIHILLKEVQ